MFNVVLINPPERTLGTSRHYLPQPLIYLASYLESNGVSTNIVDLRYDSSFDDYISSQMRRLKRYLLKTNTGGKYSHSNWFQVAKGQLIDSIVKTVGDKRPNLVGIGCFTNEVLTVLKITTEIKKRMDVPIVVGGIHPTLFPEHMIYQGSPVDFAVIGEGEETLLELSYAIESGRGVYDHIDGLAFLKDGKFFKTKIREVMKEFKINPSNVYNKIDMDFYTRPNRSIARNISISGVQIYTTRGCPFRCSFCANPLIWTKNVHFKTVRYKPVGLVMDEIEYLIRNYKIDGFYLLDDTFMMDPNHVKIFCSELKKRRINLIWGAETRSNLVTEELVKIIKDAGCIQLDIGVESGSDDVLKRVKKGIKVKDTIEAFRILHKFKIRGLANILCNHPEETMDELNETLKLINIIKPTTMGISFTVPLVGTELYEKYVKDKPKTKEEMFNLYESCEDWSNLVAESRFHISNYKLDTEHYHRLFSRILFKYGWNTEIKINREYLKLLLKTKRKLQYIHTLLRDFVVVIDRVVTYTLKNIRSWGFLQNGS